MSHRPELEQGLMTIGELAGRDHAAALAGLPR
jgi:hypothetical protein